MGRRETQLAHLKGKLKDKDLYKARMEVSPSHLGSLSWTREGEPAPLQLTLPCTQPVCGTPEGLPLLVGGTGSGAWSKGPGSFRIFLLLLHVPGTTCLFTNYFSKTSCNFCD